MAKPFAKAFYKSSAWRHCREEYIKSVYGLCEMCYAQGIIRKGDELHHKVKLTPDNINNPCITLNPDNLISFVASTIRQCTKRTDTKQKIIKDIL